MILAFSLGDVQNQTIQTVNDAAAWGLAVSTALIGVLMTTALLRLFLEKL